MNDRGVSTMARWTMFGLLAAVLLAGCGLVKFYAPYRYRLTVEVETPHGIHAGSSVIELEPGEVGTTLGGAAVEVRGEAVAVDLPGGRMLFALLRADGFSNWPASVMEVVNPVPFRQPRDKPTDTFFRRQQKAIRANGKLMIVPHAANFGPSGQPMGTEYHGELKNVYPVFVRFRDPRDPKTVERVDPDNLAASFGPGVRLRRITVQLTDDSVTRGIATRLEWLQNQRGQLVSATKDDPKILRELSTITEGDFSIGLGR